MSTKYKKASFSTHAHIKNIIGKELINDDNVAVMELVKNSYDAGATKVNIKFKNLTDEDLKKSELIIKDDGIGMSEEDILTKWLNIAYSSKKNNHTQNNRYQAGNKGVGRFSCDRLGKKLNLYTRQKDNVIVHLKVYWKDFEDAKEIDTQIQDIPVLIREIGEVEFKEETGFDVFEQGTIIQILDLNESWIEFDKKGNLFNDIMIDKTKLLKLKNSLERLINPNQSFDEHSFKIYISSNEELNEDKSTPYHEKVTGEVKNQIFEKLDFKTTFIESYITEDGTKIVTELKDKNEVIFRLIEKNIEYPLLSSIKITIYYLNPYAKGFFKKQTGLDSVQFGSVYLFINGFRIPPYGERENDALGLEVRKGQGTARYFGNREILGRIEISDFDNNFRIISSREGIVQNSYYKQLIRDSEKTTRKYNGFFYATLKRLEKYVVEGLKWDSLPENIKEATVQKEIVDGKWDESKEVYKLGKKESLLNLSEIIRQMLSVNQKNILDLYLNEELIENLIEEDREKTNKKLQDFIKDFGKLSTNTLDENTLKAIKSLTKNIDDEELSKGFKDILTQKQSIEDELKEEKKSKSELYKIFRQKVKKDKQKAKEKEKKLEESLRKVEQEKLKKDEQVLFLQSIQPLEKTELIKLQHHIGLYAETIEDTILDFKMTLDEEETITKEQITAYLTDISLEAQKILAINKYSTKANFLSKSQSINKDIVQFISEYIENIYKFNTNRDLTLKINTNDISYKCKFEPLIITIIIDNLLSNSKKANAKNVNILFIKKEDLIIEYTDDGNGLDNSISQPDSIFDIGITTTSGSGLGLHHIRESLQRMKNSTIKVSKIEKGIKFIIRLKI